MGSLRPDSGMPLYRQLSDAIRENIVSGVWAPDSQIPSELELREMFGVSRITVRKAVEELVEDELLVKRQGKGTFVAPVKIKKQAQKFLNFTEACKDAGMVPSAKVISLEVCPGTRSQARFFGCGEDEPMVIIKRVRLANKKPVIFETNIFPSTFKYLLLEDLENSLYEILRARHVYPDTTHKTIEVCLANEIEARFLEVDQGTPLLLLDDMVYDRDMKPLHICKQIIRTDIFKLTI